jgi:hypothetical protein
VVYLDVLVTYKIDGDCSYSITVYAPMIWIEMRSQRPRAYIRVGRLFSEVAKDGEKRWETVEKCFFINLLKNEGWGGGMGNCWSCS